MYGVSAGLIWDRGFGHRPPFVGWEGTSHSELGFPDMKNHQHQGWWSHVEMDTPQTDDKLIRAPSNVLIWDQRFLVLLRVLQFGALGFRSRSHKKYP